MSFSYNHKKQYVKNNTVFLTKFSSLCFITKSLFPIMDVRGRLAYLSKHFLLNGPNQICSVRSPVRSL